MASASTRSSTSRSSRRATSAARSRSSPPTSARHFFLVGEVAGGDFNEDRYLDVLGPNLNAALDIGEMRPTLNAVAKGLAAPRPYFDGFDPGRAVLGSHRNLGNRHVSILDDHDHVFGDKLRFSTDAASEHQVAAGVILQLFTLGIPCIYYGTEQALAGPEASERHVAAGLGAVGPLPARGDVRPAHPGPGDGLAPPPAAWTRPCPASARSAQPATTASTRRPGLSADRRGLRARRRFPVLRPGRHTCARSPSSGAEISVTPAREIVAWSRILDDEEALCVVNANGREERGARVLVDADLNPPGSAMTVALNTAEAAGISRRIKSARRYPSGSENRGRNGLC